MRTTLTIEPDVAQQIRRRMAQKKASLKQVVNEALRIGLTNAGHREPAAPFSVQPYPFQFKPGIDLDKLNQLADELEAEESVKSLSR